MNDNDSIEYFWFRVTQQIAYQLWESDGRRSNSDLEYWFKAEQIINNMYMISCKFTGLDYENENEGLTIISNNKKW